MILKLYYAGDLFNKYQNVCKSSLLIAIYQTAQWYRSSNVLMVTMFSIKQVVIVDERCCRWERTNKHFWSPSCSGSPMCRVFLFHVCTVHTVSLWTRNFSHLCFMSFPSISVVCDLLSLSSGGSLRRVGVGDQRQLKFALTLNSRRSHAKYRCAVLVLDLFCDQWD